MSLAQKAKRQANTNFGSYQYFAKLPQTQIIEGMDAPVFEVVSSYKMVKNAVCVKVPACKGSRFIVKHYDTIILQWVQYENNVSIEILEYNCSPTSNRQIDGILSVLVPNIPRSEYNKIPAYRDNKMEFRGPLTERV